MFQYIQLVAARHGTGITGIDAFEHGGQALTRLLCINAPQVMSCVRTEQQQPSTSTQAMLARGDVKEVLEWLCGVLDPDM
jgi:hypothetical protein